MNYDETVDCKLKTEYDAGGYSTWVNDKGDKAYIQCTRVRDPLVRPDGTSETEIIVERVGTSTNDPDSREKEMVKEIYYDDGSDVPQLIWERDLE